jgi:hypothetical protein
MGMKILSACLILITLGCSSLQPPVENSGTATGAGPGARPGELEEHRRAWERKKLTLREYHLTTERDCECAPNETVLEVAVRAKDENILKYKAYRDGKSVPGYRLGESDYPTVEKLFDLIERSIKADRSAVHVVYNPVYGYPEVITIGNEMMTSSREFSVSVEKFHPVPR